MTPEQVPSELVALLEKALREGGSARETLAKVLTEYDAIYSDRLNAFWQVWTNGWSYGIDEMPESPAAPIPMPSQVDPKKSFGRPRRERKVRVTSLFDPNYERVYNSVMETAEKENLSETSIYAKLAGRRTRYKKIYELNFEWVE